MIKRLTTALFVSAFLLSSPGLFDASYNPITLGHASTDAQDGGGGGDRTPITLKQLSHMSKKELLIMRHSKHRLEGDDKVHSHLSFWLVHNFTYNPKALKRIINRVNRAKTQEEKRKILAYEARKLRKAEKLFEADVDRLDEAYYKKHGKNFERNRAAFSLTNLLLGEKFVEEHSNVRKSPDAEVLDDAYERLRRASQLLRFVENWQSNSSAIIK